MSDVCVFHGIGQETLADHEERLRFLETLVPPNIIRAYRLGGGP